MAQAKAGSTAPSTTPTVETAPLQHQAETRAPGSGWVLPANPFTSLTDDKLEAFIDCTLYEEAEGTGDPDVLAMPNDDAFVIPVFGREPSASVRTPPTGVATVRLPGVSQDPATKPSLATAIAGTVPTKGREQISTLLGFAPLAVPKGEAPVVVPTQPPKPFGKPKVAADESKPTATTATPEPKPPRPEPKVTEGNTIELAPELAAASQAMRAATATAVPARANTERIARPVIKPRDAVIAVACAVGLVLVVVLASSTSKKTRPAQPGPTDKVADPPADKAVEPNPDVTPPDAAVDDQAIEMDPAPTKPKAATCKLTINSAPPGARVLVDNLSVGKTPITVDGPCKRRKVEIYATGFEPQTKRFVVQDGEVLDFALKPKDAKADPKLDPKVDPKLAPKPGTTKPGTTKPGTATTPTPPKGTVDI